MKKSKKTRRDILRGLSEAELLWKLREQPPEIQAVICHEIGRRRITEGVPQLRECLTSAVPAVREAAAEALGEVGDSSIANELVKLLLDRNQLEGVRDTCAFALAKLEYAPAVAELTLLLFDPSPSVRICAATALATIRNPEVREWVENALAIELDSAVRAALLKLLDLLPPRAARAPRPEPPSTTGYNQLDEVASA